jgi:site-specific recombinase XerD
MGRTAEGWKLVPRRGILHVRFTWGEGKARRRYELSTGERDPGKAAPEAARIYADVISGRYRPLVATSNASLIELIPKWLLAIESDLDEETVATYEGYSTGWLKFFGSTLGTITRASASDYRRARLLKVSASSVRKELSAIRNFLAWCLEQEIVGDVPIVPGVPKKALGTRAIPKRPVIDITPEHVEAIFRELPVRGRGGHLVRARFIIAYETGLRPATLDALRAPEHFVRGAVDLTIADEHDKARFGRPLPLSPRARSVLDEVVNDIGPIFGKHDYREVWRSAVIASGAPVTMVPYDLRHARIQHLLDSGEPLTGVAYLAGHTLLTTTNNYARGSRRQAERAVSGVKTGVGPLESRVAKEGGRTPTRVTSLEPERQGVPGNHRKQDSSSRQSPPPGATNTGLTGARPQSWVHEATANLLGLMSGVA